MATPETPGAFAYGLRLMGIDGTVLDVPDSPANAAAFDRPSGQRGAGAFPQVRKLSLVELGTHAEVGLAIDSIRCGERTMVEWLLARLTTEMLLLLDQGFYSADLWRKLAARRLNMLARVTTQVILRPIRSLADGSYLARIYQGEGDRWRDRGGVMVRVIRYTLDDPRRVNHGKEHVLITTLLDESICPAMDLILLYHERWEHELVFDEQKTHQDPVRLGKPTPLRSETPAGVFQEVYALSLAHYAIRRLMFEAAGTADLDPDRLSFSGCFGVLKCRLPECGATTPARMKRWYEGLLWEMQGERAASQPDQLPSDQEAEVELEEEAGQGPGPPTVGEDLSRDGSYAPLEQFPVGCTAHPFQGDLHD